MISPLITRSILLLSIITVSANENLCPSKCTCRRINQRDEIKLRCGEGKNKVASLDDIDLLNIANDVVQFNLSNNLLDTFFPKVQLIALQKLDLSGNRLTELQNNQFSELPNVRRLDVSNNKIKSIEVSAFAKLGSLEKLKLNQNQISTIAVGTFDPLVSLKQLDISSNPLACDCSLLWLLDYSQKESVKLVSNPTCATPPSFKGLLLRKLKVGVDIHCKSPALRDFPIVEMKPPVNQVVFEGDALVLQCAAPSIGDSYSSPMRSKLEWTWMDSDPKLHFPDVTVEDRLLQSTGLIASTLRMPRLTRNHTGLWSCLLVSVRGNHSKGIMVVVISDDTRYCPIAVTADNKGTYTWPRTVVNYTATVPCEAGNLNYDASLRKASYFCAGDGRWEGLNTSMCSYTSETTKIFEQFSKVNSSVAESAKHFRNYTSDVGHFKDKMDVVFAVETMENYLKFLTVGQIGGLLMDVVNHLLQLPKAYLWQAEYAYGSCGRIVNMTEQLAGIGSTSLLHKSNVAVETFPVKKHAFSNLRCTWYVDISKTTEHLFYCVADSQNDITELPGKTIEASISIPETLFDQLEDQEYLLPDRLYNILIAMYSSNKFFPIDSTRQEKEDVVSAVAGVKLVGFDVSNLTDPVFVMLRIPPTVEGSAPIPVWWNNGTWTPDGCQFSHEYQDHVVFYCHNFGYYGLLHDVTTMRKVYAGAKFRLSHPAIYVGSVILFASLLVVILTYLLSYHSIHMPKKAKHSLINLWLAVCLLCFFYVFGIYQTEDLRICEIVGMLLHYFTLSSVLWVCVGVNCMYKRLSKSDVMELQDDDLPSEQPVKKPILGLYFVGWGVPIIVCGISAAINIRDYASPGYCFLRPGPPLSALYVPMIILSIFLGICFLLVRCAISSMDANGHLSEGTQATENVDLDLLEPNFPIPETRSVLSASSKTASSEMEDQEHSPSTQLKAYVIFLCLYGLSWSSCALATVECGFFSFESDVFSIAYAIFATVLSAFTIFFYCVARSDVRGRWTWFGRCVRRKQCFRTRNVSDATRNVPHIHIQPPAVANDLQVTSRSSSRSSTRTKSNSHASNILKSAADLNVAYAEQTKVNNVNLIMLHRQQYRAGAIPNIIENPTSAAEVFYNPHQSIVARKFFRRQKRHMMKRNNLVPRQRDSDSASVLSELKKNSTDQSIFGTSSKVNNTNIHVEQARKRPKNPNIFSDSADDYECPDIGDIVLNAERFRKREGAKVKKRRCEGGYRSPENGMRSVSQQCTLEYSSENISDSILDKSPERAEPKGVEEEGESVPRIYVNPSHDLPHKGVQSRASSVNDLDDLYQQIRRGPKEATSQSRSFVHSFSLTRNSPCFSDSDINSYVNDQKYKHRTSNTSLNDDVETTV